MAYISVDYDKKNMTAVEIFTTFLSSLLTVPCQQRPVLLLFNGCYIIILNVCFTNHMITKHDTMISFEVMMHMILMRSLILMRH